MDNELLDFAENNDSAGFRLERFEFLNWGTFDKNVWKIEPRGHNALLTGEIGSGKSTVVDALTTLLVAPQRIIYNKAAGADTRERTLASYVRGYYKTEKDAAQFAARPVALRTDDSYSVLLGHFHNRGFDQHISLAQVFWMKETRGQPERFYVIADRSLAILQDFQDFGTQMTDLRKRLRKSPGIQVFDTFPPYAAELRRRMSIGSDQALELFYQTVSMKAVGNLTDFVRAHMLEEPPARSRIAEICRNFDNLNRAHEAVVRARDQIGRLEPLAADCDRHDASERLLKELRACRDALSAYFAGRKASLLDERIGAQEAELRKLEDRINAETEKAEALRRQLDQTRQSLAEQGGGRLEWLAQEIERLSRERERRAQKSEAYGTQSRLLALPDVFDVDRFHSNRAEARALLARVESELDVQQRGLVDLQVAFRNLEDADARLAVELESLRRRPTNISLQALEMRRRICETLGLLEADMPFAGELLQVRENEAEWEGALERLLHNFALSLLVPEELYVRVARYAEDTHLAGRLVYFRVRTEKALSDEEWANPLLVVHKLTIKPDSAFHEWLVQEVARHFHYVCCERLEDFQREVRALTRQGQIKSQGRRHEKDDRFALQDRTRYVLGWDNHGKIQALELQKEQGEHLMEDLQRKMTERSRRLKELGASRDAARDLMAFAEFHEIDWASVARQIEDLKEERKRLLESSDRLRQMREAVVTLEDLLRKAEESLRKRSAQQAITQHDLERTRRERLQALEEAATLPEAARTALIDKLQTLEIEALGERKVSIENCDKTQTEMRTWIQNRLDAESKRKERLIEKISQAMQAFKEAYPLETREFDARLESAPEFRQMLGRLSEEDLPRHEASFRRLLNEGTIQDIALFQNLLEKEEQEIRERIQRINDSLREIEYTPATFIQLVSDRTADQEVRQFQQSLRACLGGALAGREEDLYTEQKFLQVKELIDRFNGREGTAEIDKKWTDKVTDVRNWAEFSVSERWKENGEEKEFYSDSAGKSGGQKEKLAYTILASALAYQFGLERGVTRSRSFRFVMIDEAFGRGSDESAHYGLELFKRLNLQLLIVTPLQKIHVIEDYVRSVHLIHNEDGQRSKLQSLTIEEVRARRNPPDEPPSAPDA